jgi:hypothetical protein
MLSEGSTFGPLVDQPIGRIEEVQPSYQNNVFDAHPVYRSGLAMGVGFAEENMS